jgi:nucleoside-diphosphate-sugar epimerase
MRGSVAIVGAGQIGYAASQAFAAAGWEVTVLARKAPAWPCGNVRFRRYLAGEDAAPKSDVVLDTIAFDEGDVARYHPGEMDRLIVVSSASVYCDAAGRSLDEASQSGFPRFAGQISEENTTVDPGPETYSTRKVRMEGAVLTRFGARATVLRPCAIHGPWSRHPREWWFVKRILDGRRRIPLAHRGRSRFQTTAAGLLGEAAVRAASRAVGGILNISDPEAPDVAQIGLAIAAIMKTPIDIFPVAEDAGPVGRTPWSVPLPMIVSGKYAERALELPARPYRSAVEPAVSWLAKNPTPDWCAMFPQLAYPWDLFDYDAEDRFLASK